VILHTYRKLLLMFCIQKRRHLSRENTNDSSTETHRYRSLGSAYVNSIESFEVDSGEYGVDSPMHFLSITSPCPSPPDDIVEEQSKQQNDMDMDDSSGSGHHTTLQTTSPSSSSSSSTFVPRQVKRPNFTRTPLMSTAPFQPSPLIHSQRFQSSSSNTQLSGRSHMSSSQSSSSEDSSNKKEQTDTNLEQGIDSRSSSCSSSPRQGKTSTSTSHLPTRMIENPFGIARTPSPSPLSKSSEIDVRKLHHSPGLSQSAFPGGKQMLRYTMGFREDCASCQSKSKWPRLV
jgi:hypothetical protein